MTTTHLKWLFAACALCCAASGFAQYKYVDANGRVTYSDLPPPTNARDVTQKKLNDAAAPATALPFELQQAATRYPVTLYTGDRCAPCEEGRAYLRNRGIPFAEKTVSSGDDIAAFRQQSPDGTAPVIDVGGRKAVGFAQSSWSALLDNAGYPATSMLPRDYRAAAPTPLSPNTKAAAQPIAPQNQTPSQAQASTASEPQPQPSNAPPGFRF